MKVWRPQTANALKKGEGHGWEPLLAEVQSCATVGSVWAWWSHYLLHRHRDYPEGWSLALRDACDDREGQLLAGEHHAELNDAYRATMGGPAPCS